MIKIYIDAATDQQNNLSAGGMILIQNKTQLQIHQPLLAKTNNEAEFEIMVFALKYLLENNLNDQAIFIHSDSKIVTQSIEKKYVKDRIFKDYLRSILVLKKSFDLLFIDWIEESRNKGADRLAKQALQKSKKS